MRHFAQIQYSAVNALYWMMYSVATAFSSVYLLPRGYSNAEIGYIICSGFLIGAWLQGVVAGAADRSNRYSPTVFLMMTQLLFVPALVGLQLYQDRSIGLTVSFILLFAAAMASQPQINALLFYLERCRCSINYGVSRSIGSLGYASMSWVLGTLIARTSPDIIRPFGWAVFITTEVVLLFVAKQYPLSAAMTKTKQQTAQKGVLKRYPSFVFLLAGTLILFTGHAIVNSFLFQILQNVGGSESDLGTLNAYTASLEVPIMCLFGYLLKRFSERKLLFIGAVFFLVKAVGVFLANNVAGLYVALFLQCLSYAIFAPASVYFIGRTMAEGDANRGQAYSVMMIAGGNILASLVGGVLIDRFTVVGATAFAVGVSIVGVLCIMVMYAKTATAKKQKEALC